MRAPAVVADPQAARRGCEVAAVVAGAGDAEGLSQASVSLGQSFEP